MFLTGSLFLPTVVASVDLNRAVQVNFILLSKWQ